MLRWPTIGFTGLSHKALAQRCANLIWYRKLSRKALAAGELPSHQASVKRWANKPAASALPLSLSGPIAWEGAFSLPALQLTAAVGSFHGKMYCRRASLFSGIPANLAFSCVSWGSGLTVVETASLCKNAELKYTRKYLRISLSGALVDVTSY